jgi:hypothetical protein
MRCGLEITRGHRWHITGGIGYSGSQSWIRKGLVRFFSQKRTGFIQVVFRAMVELVAQVAVFSKVLVAVFSEALVVAQLEALGAVFLEALGAVFLEALEAVDMVTFLILQPSII